MENSILSLLLLNRVLVSLELVETALPENMCVPKWEYISIYRETEEGEQEEHEFEIIHKVDMYSVILS